MYPRSRLEGSSGVSASASRKRTVPKSEREMWPGGLKENVLRLDVAVDGVVGCMDVVEGQEEFRRVKGGYGLGTGHSLLLVPSWR